MRPRAITAGSGENMFVLQHIVGLVAVSGTLALSMGTGGLSERALISMALTTLAAWAWLLI